MEYLFYNVETNFPLSAYNNTPDWGRSPQAKLHVISGGTVYIDEIPAEHHDAPFAWRVVDIQFSREDTLMTYFKAYGLNGEHLAHAVFGVNGGHPNDQIRGGFAYRPKYGNKYVVTRDNQILTPNSGGYIVQPLCMLYPAEGVAFGMLPDPDGEGHLNLDIHFRLFELGDGYPNDVKL